MSYRTVTLRTVLWSTGRRRSGSTATSLTVAPRLNVLAALRAGAESCGNVATTMARATEILCDRSILTSGRSTALALATAAQLPAREVEPCVQRVRSTPPSEPVAAQRFRTVEHRAD